MAIRWQSDGNHVKNQVAIRWQSDETDEALFGLGLHHPKVLMRDGNQMAIRWQSPPSSQSRNRSSDHPGTRGRRRGCPGAGRSGRSHAGTLARGTNSSAVTRGAPAQIRATRVISMHSPAHLLEGRSHALGREVRARCVPGQTPLA